MGKIVISENVSLDGVIEDPAGDEGSRHGRWVGRITDYPEVGKRALDEALGAAAFLLGRRSYEWFPQASPRWRVGRQVEQPAQVRRLLDPRRSGLE